MEYHSSANKFLCSNGCTSHPSGMNSTRAPSRFLFAAIYRPRSVSLSNLIFPCQACPSIRWKISRRLVGPPCLWSFSSILCTRFDGECHVDRCLFRSLESILSGFNGNSSLSALADGLSDVSFLGDDSFEYRCVFGDPSFGFYRLLPIDSPPPRQTLSYFCLFFSRAFLPFLLATVLLPAANANFSFDEKG